MLGLVLVAVTGNAAADARTHFLHCSATLDITNQFAIAPPGEKAEERQTTTRQVW